MKPGDTLNGISRQTGVAVRAFDAERLQGGLGLRIAQHGEHLAGDRVDLPEGAIVIADERRPVGLVFGETGTAAMVARATRRIVLCVVRVPGIPEISVEEALWTAGGILASEGRSPKRRSPEIDPLDLPF